MIKKRGINLIAIALLLLLILSASAPAFEKRAPQKAKDLQSLTANKTILKVSTRVSISPSNKPEARSLNSDRDLIVSSPCQYTLKNTRLARSYRSPSFSKEVISDFKKSDGENRIMIEIYGSNFLHPVLIPSKPRNVSELQQILRQNPYWFEESIAQNSQEKGDYLIVIMEINKDLEINEKKYLINI